MTWPKMPLSAVTTKVGSGATPRGGKESYHETGVPLIRSQNVRFEGFDRDGLAFLDSQQARDLDGVIVQANDVLLNITGASIGRVTVAPEDLAGARVNQHVCIVRPQANLLPRFLSHYLASPNVQAFMMAEQSGVTRQALTKAKILDFEVPVPTVDTQQGIVAAIESHFSRLDAATATLERVQRNLERYRASVLKAAVEGRLVPTEAELAKKEGRSYEPASVLLKRILAERRRCWEEAELAKLKAKGKPPIDDRWKTKYEEPAAPDTDGLPELPEGWCWTSLDALLREPLRNGHSARESKDGSGIRTLTLSAVTLGDFSAANTKVTVALPDKVADLWLLPGDILVERSNTPELVGLSALFRGPDQFAIFPDLMIRVRTTPRVDVEFIATLMRENRVRSCWRSQAQGIAGTMPKISQDVIAKTLVPLPPLPEQQRIVNELSARLSSADAAAKNAALSDSRVRRLRQSILNWAFEGRLVRAAAEHPLFDAAVAGRR